MKKACQEDTVQSSPQLALSSMSLQGVFWPRTRLARLQGPMGLPGGKNESGTHAINSKYEVTLCYATVSGRA